MKNFAKEAAAWVMPWVLTTITILGISWVIYQGVAYYAPRYEAVRRDTMIESRAYTEGTIRELYTLKRQYDASANENERATISAAARHEFSIFPHERLPADLQAFLAQIGG